MKKPFHFKFKDRSLIVDKIDYQGHNGTLSKSTEKDRKYIKKFAPEKSREFEKHLIDFNRIFDNIDNQIKK